jgi:hypothetical protein
MPDFSLCNIPKRGKIDTEWPKNIPNDPKIYQMKQKYIPMTQKYTKGP